MGVKQLVPLSIRERGRWTIDGLRLTSGWRSFRAFQRLAHAHGAPVEVQLKALGPNPIHLRPGTTDRDVVRSTFERGSPHRPPSDIHPRLIVDLGANNGLTMADMAVSYPGARIIGVELDPANAALARQNVRLFGDRCEVITAAVWTEDGAVPYVSRPGLEWTSAIDRNDSGEKAAKTVPAMSLNTLLRPHPHVDYMKMDIEGAEKEVLQADCAWAPRVRCINVEVHTEHYAIADCVRDLERIGFRTEVLGEGSVGYVIGRRSDRPT